MADLTVTATNVRMLDILQIHTISGIAGEALTLGQPVYIDGTTGLFRVARGNAVGTAKVAGIVVGDQSPAAGSAITVLQYGRLVGWDLSSTNYGTTVYLSASTGGKIADAAATGTGNVVFPLGTVLRKPDQSGTKYILFDISPSAAAPVALS